MIPIKIGIPVQVNGQSFAATDVERSDFVHLLLGALQRLCHHSRIHIFNQNSVLSFCFAQTLNHFCSNSRTTTSSPTTTTHCREYSDHNGSLITNLTVGLILTKFCHYANP